MANIEEQIAYILKQSSDLIEKDQNDKAYESISLLVQNHPEWVDERLNAEVYILLKQMEFKKIIKEYSFYIALSECFRYCEKEYLKYGMIDKDNYENVVLNDNNVIWWCWLQGIESAPDIVQSCYKSLEKLGKKIEIVTENTIHSYINLPSNIIAKYERGLISKTHYTDLIRLQLLVERGGTWIDATTFISDNKKILPIIDEEDIFLYRSGNVSEYIVFDSWFIHAKTKSAILESTKNMLFAYWEKEDELKNYFLLHIMMTMACQIYKEEFNRIPLFSNEPAHVLQHDMFKQYSEKRWKQIIEMSDVHKLTYKYDKGDYQGTFLGHILNYK